MVQKIKTRPYLLGLLVIFVFLVVRFFLLRVPSSEMTFKVPKGDLVDKVQVSGNFTTASSLSVDAPATGILDEVFVKNKDEVKKGDKLFHINATATQDQKAKAYSDYQSAQTDLDTANNNLRDKQAALNNIYDELQGHANDESYTQIQTRTTAEVAKDNAYAAVTKAQAALDKAKLAFNETKSTTVTSPADGTVVNFLKKEGDLVSAEGSDKSVLAVADLSDPHLSVSISESYIPRIKIGQKATIVFDALKDKTFEGSVESLDTVGTKVQGVVSYGARITVSDLTDNIRPGMSAIVTIETLRVPNVIYVPESSIVERDGKTYVENARNHKLIEVTLGTRGVSKAEVTDGLNEGITILANPKTN